MNVTHSFYKALPWKRLAGRQFSAAAREAHVLAACNVRRQETIILEKSALRGGFSFRTVGVGEAWHGLGTKLAIYDRALKELVGNVIHPQDPMMLLDAWDTVILGTAKELWQKLELHNALQLGGPVLCAADRICAPEYKLAPRVERLYPHVRTPWRYPNSGGLAGTAQALASFIHALVHSSEGGSFSADGDDQLRVQEFLLACARNGNAFNVELDENCSFFQCMGEPVCGWEYEQASDAAPRPRIRSLMTGEKSLVAHGCGGHGRWFLAEIYHKLDLLDFLQLDEQSLTGLEYAGLVPPGHLVSKKHWVDQPPWEFPFQIFHAIRSIAIAEQQGTEQSG